MSSAWFIQRPMGFECQAWSGGIHTGMNLVAHSRLARCSTCNIFSSSDVWSEFLDRRKASLTVEVHTGGLMGP